MLEPSSFGQNVAGRYFVKMHGLHNHFIITDGRLEAYKPDVAEVVRLCDRHIGVGGDQLVVIEPPTQIGQKGGAEAFMRIINVDGREVEACGNATRCVAWLLMDEQATDSIVIETLAGLIECNRAGEYWVQCVMGRLTTAWQDIPLAEARDTLHLDLGIDALGDAVVLNIGNPHVVFFVDDLSAIDIEALAPGLQRNPLFPDEVNVGVAQITSAEHMHLTVYERGAGLTTACGSGACAAVYAAQLRGLTSESTLTVTMPAGDMTIEIRDDSVAVMTGPVAHCFSGYY
jgi:diaminopimelate epimerase